MINKGKVGNNNKRSKWEEKKMRLKSKKVETENKLKAGKRNNTNCASCNNSSIINISRNNNKFSI